MSTYTAVHLALLTAAIGAVTFYGRVRIGINLAPRRRTAMSLVAAAAGAMAVGAMAAGAMAATVTMNGRMTGARF